MDVMKLFKVRIKKLEQCWLLSVLVSLLIALNTSAYQSSVFLVDFNRAFTWWVLRCHMEVRSILYQLHQVENESKFREKTVKEVIGNIQKWSDRQDSEEVRAIYLAGSYVLSTAYKQFFVPSATWHNWIVERKKIMSWSFKITCQMFLTTFRNKKMLDKKPTMPKE